ncbi:choice-of-anchor L domain-containing protein [Marinifilum fragile]|uniref:choice-of-anchor L domain-containing protein n=1 Tax=Marinifilum fragile TaxID=570161 RepID=UPI002AAB4F50|nr:choice-of-anchor L domain-containing protein [Marinifilum fragile]
MRSFTLKTHLIAPISKLFQISLLFVLFIGSTTSLAAQVTIWSEDFSTYSGYTGVDGGSYPYRNLGDYPARVTKWTLNVDNCTLSDANDYVQLVGDARLNFRDVDGPAVWLSEMINISGYTDISISMSIRESGSLESNDYIRCQYRIDGGNWINFYSRNNDFGSTTATVNGLNGNNNLQIRVVARNDNGNEYYYLDDIVVRGDRNDLVSLSLGSNSIAEDGGSTLVVATLNSVQTSDVTVLLGFSGSASISDYTIADSEIVIPAGSLSASILLASLNDADVEGDENLIIDIDNVINGTEDGMQQVTITIVDDDMPSTDPILVDRQSPENTYSANALVQNVLITGCLTASNVTYSGDEALGLGYFNAGTSDFPLASGIILSTGEVVHAEGPNSNDGISDNIGGVSGDSDVNTLTGNNGRDAQILEFDFVPAGDVLAFRYVFASEEYPEYTCGNYNDVFAFIISGPGITADAGLSGRNIALIPGTTNPVTINNVNNRSCGNSTFYVDETNGFATEFDGRTTVLTATAAVQPCQTYHIRLIIADVWDASYNSAVFLEARSFKSNEVVIENGVAGNNDVEFMYEGCAKSFIKFLREDGLDTELTFALNISGSAENGVDYIYTDEFGSQIGDGKIPETVTMPVGVDEIIYYYKALSDGIIEGDETMRLSFLKSCPCSAPDYYEKVVTIIDVPEIEATPTSLVSCLGGIPTATIAVNLKGGLDPSDYQYSLDGGALQDDNVFTLNNPPVGSVHTIKVQDRFACNSEDFEITIPEVTPIESNAGPDKNICEGETPKLEGSGGIYYEWSCSPASGINYLSDVNAPNPTIGDNIPFGIYTFTLTVKESASSSASCVDTDEMVLTVKENAHFTIAADKAEYCSAELINLSSTVSNSSIDDNYLWTPSNGLDSPTSKNTTAVYNTTSLIAKDFSLTITKSSGCSNTEYISGVVINPHPVVSLNPSSVVCTTGTNGQLIIDVTGGTPNGSSPFYNYSWSHDSGLNSPSASSLGVGTYTITVRDSKSCQSSLEVQLKPEPKPIGIFY